jgi:hypothetical protein
MRRRRTSGASPPHQAGPNVCPLPALRPRLGGYTGTFEVRDSKVIHRIEFGSRPELRIKLDSLCSTRR